MRGMAITLCINGEVLGIMPELVPHRFITITTTTCTECTTLIWEGGTLHRLPVQDLITITERTRIIMEHLRLIPVTTKEHRPLMEEVMFQVHTEAQEQRFVHRTRHPVVTEEREQRFVHRTRHPVVTEAQEQRFAHRTRHPVVAEAQGQRFVRRIHRPEVLVREVTPRVQADLQVHREERFLARLQVAEEAHRHRHHDRPEAPAEDVN